MGLVEIRHGETLTTSKIIADSFGKIHRDVLRSIKNLDCSDEFRVRNYVQSSYTSEQNKVLICYDITRDGFAFLCMGFTGASAAEWKEKYIGAFNSMERSLLNVDLRMNQLTIESGEIKEAGSKWAKLGHEINNAKKENKKLCLDLIKDVQLSLGFGE
jgi:Rha family phage regulatory protein